MITGIYLNDEKAGVLLFREWQQEDSPIAASGCPFVQCIKGSQKGAALLLLLMKNMTTLIKIMKTTGIYPTGKRADRTVIPGLSIKEITLYLKLWPVFQYS